MIVKFTPPSIHNTYSINNIFIDIFKYVQEAYPISGITNIIHKSTCISLLLILTQPNIQVANKYISANTFGLTLHGPISIDKFLPIGPLELPSARLDIHFTTSLLPLII